MKRLKLYILLFTLALAVPSGWLVLETWRGLAQEEEAQLRHFAEELFDRMEIELDELVRVEEARAIDAYTVEGRGKATVPRLAPPVDKPYVMGWFQNNPDGTFDTPMRVANPDLFAELTGMNEAFNLVRGTTPAPPGMAAPTAKTRPTEVAANPNVPILAETKPRKESPTLAERYLESPRQRAAKQSLGQGEKRVEQVPQEQARNLAPSVTITEELLVMDSGGAFYTQKEQTLIPPAAAPAREQTLVETDLEREEYATAAEPEENAAEPEPAPLPDDEEKAVRVEVDPLQTAPLGDGKVYLFRRVVVGNQVFRQGVLLDMAGLLDHLADKHFMDQPMARYARLSLSAHEGGTELAQAVAGARSDDPAVSLSRVFPRPFGFVMARLDCAAIPRSEGRTMLTAMTAALAGIMLLGLLAIYHAVRMVSETARRRTNFVSSVTHELKTPLTNIRMYVEMLEQGIAATPEREKQYLGVLSSESSRLSRLITNVLEFSRLERKKRALDMQEGDLGDVVDEVERVMSKTLANEGYTLAVEYPDQADITVRYDREVLVGLVFNLMENSVKFGCGNEEKRITLAVTPRDGKVDVSVSDTGPGIPPHALKKIFDDFYRVEDEMTRSTKGTGIGLALVQKFAEAMGGTVKAANNKGPGCTITITLPKTG